MFERDDIVKLWGVRLARGAGFYLFFCSISSRKKGDTTSL